jgi:DNA-binding sugar fermentation-stimulating protein
MMYHINDVCEAIVIARPSKQIKSPYLADIQLIDDIEVNVHMCHSPSLGCCGLIASGTHVIIGKNKGTTCKSAYTIYHAICGDRIIGTHPMIAQNIAGVYLKQTYDQLTWQTEKKIDDGPSRFDFVAHDTNGKLIMVTECKAIPLGDIEDYDYSIRKKRGYLQDMDRVDKVAIFPDGFRKNKSDPVSPRALKHVQELQHIHQKSDGTITCMLLFVCQRNDCNRFTISQQDPIYRAAILEALRSGVIIRCIAVDWINNGATAQFIGELPLDLLY